MVKSQGAKPKFDWEVSKQGRPRLVEVPSSATTDWKKISVFLVLICLGAGLSMFWSAGPSWDEELCHLNGKNFWNWIRTFGANRDSLNSFDLYLYGAFFDFLIYAFSQVLPFDVFDTGHLLVVLTGVVGLWGAYRLGDLLGGPRAGFFAMLFLAFTPSYVGHSLMNPKDLPFAVLYLWSLYFLALYLKSLPHPRKSTVWGVGILMGLTLGVRVGGVFLVGYLGLFVGAWLLLLRPNYLKKQDWKRFALHALWILGTAYLVMILFWPYAQVRPLSNPVRGLLWNAYFDFNPRMLFRGQEMFGKSVGPFYLPTWFSIRLPEFYLTLLFGLGFAIRGLLASGKHRMRNLLLSLVVFAILFPPVIAILLGSTLYDGLRHFLFLIPPLAVLAGVSADIFFKEASRAMKGIVGITVAASLLLTATDMVRLHPYEYVYFNRLIAGGIPKAAYEFDFDLWATSAKEGTEWVLKNYRSERPVRIASGGADYQVRHWIEQAGATDRFRFDRKEPHLYLDIRKRGAGESFSKGKVLHTVERFGVPLLEVKEVRKP